MQKYIADLNAEVRLLVEQAKAGKELNLEQVKADLNNKPIVLQNQKVQETMDLVGAFQASFAQAMEVLGDKLEGVMRDMNAPREVVRDDAGKIVGVKVGDTMRELQRDSNGKLTGLS
jgi:hypothetical protein